MSLVRYGKKEYIMDSKGALIIFDTPGKNCPLNILTPMASARLQIVTWGGGLLVD